MAIILDAIFKPIAEALTDAEIMQNAKPSALERALKNGSIQFTNGAFKGAINASISKEIKSYGGKFVKGAWRLPSPLLPASIQKAIRSNARTMELLNDRLFELTRAMPETVTNMVRDMSIESLGLANIDRVSKEFKNTVGKAMSVMPKFDKQARAILKTEYFDNEDLPIVERTLNEYENRTREYVEYFAQETVEKLRKNLSLLISDGRSRHDVRRAVENELNISKGRAKFIARQETSLLTSNIKEVQYKQAGVDRYIWRTVGDNRVRDKHDELNGKEYSFSNPPEAKYFSTGKPENPGHDFNCFIGSTPITMLGKPIKAFKRRYAGNVMNITTEGKTIITATINHPILTINGWRRFGDIKNGDKVFKFIGGNIFDGMGMNINERYSARKVFDLFNICFPFMRKTTTNIDFHGDGIDQEINVISINSKLWGKTNIFGLKKILYNFLTNSYSRTMGLIRQSSFMSFMSRYFPSLGSMMSSTDLTDSLNIGHLRPFKIFGLRLGSHYDTAIFQNSSNGNPRNFSFLGYLIDAFARLIFRNEYVGRDIYFIPNIGFFVCHDIIKSEISYYNDYVYNFETTENVYLADNLLVSNCRCVALAIIEW
jgi:SPP1 gp7 family putative phage head morphogenesis protein